ncbi:hypothetical protein [Methanobacterium subterraneum]|uniref:Uncharacterized protein n=1 Tax=Methanobacterium subterraneum TaxID=59277 RepID=A0A7K4DNX0_9EURY|nr:hypothetical protein [Methanobacterium subterraneum]NMO09505.1 hypothetical protein [Methanobacterium subterraneum]
MSEELNTLLKQAYYRYKDDPANSPIPLEIITEYLALEGIILERKL